MQMKKLVRLTVATAALATAATSANAYTQNTHKRFVIDAVKYMKAHPEATNFDRFKAAANAAGYTVEQAADIIGQGSFDVDDFKDTYLCGSTSGDCVLAPVFGIGSFIATYTAWWHFQNHSEGPDVHGNDLGGYNNDMIPVRGIEDDGLRAWLYNDHLDDGKGGMTGVCVWRWCAEDSEFNSYGVTEKNYRLDTYSTKSMYDDFQDTPYQPIDNLGQYWYNQFLSSPSFQTLGFALHTTDLLQPHHVWVTSGKNHGGWEGWVEDHYDVEGFYNEDAIASALSTYSAVPSNQSDVRSIMTQGGSFAYLNGGAVLHTTDHDVRVEVANKMVPHAIAMVIHILNHAADQF